MKKNRTELLGKEPIIPTVCDGPGEPGLVSVIIPTYNRGYFISKTIESVLAQTYRPLEIIVVDDGSSDDTRNVVEKYGSQIEYIYQENAGLAVGRNTGLSAAKGEFIAFQDSDDIWLPWKLKAQVALMRHVPELALVWTDMTAVNHDGDVVREKHLSTCYSVYRRINLDEHLPASGTINEIWSDCPSDLQQVPFRYGDIFGAMFLGNLVHPPTALLRRRHVSQTGGLDLTYSWTCEDYEFFWRVSRYGLGAVIESPSMLYRVGADDQLTKPPLLLYIARGNLIALQRRYRECQDQINLPEQIMKSQMADAHEWVAEEELKSDDGSRIKALCHFWESIRLHPLKKRAYIYFVCRSIVPSFVLAMLRSARLRLKEFLAMICFMINLKLNRDQLEPAYTFCVDADASVSLFLLILSDL